MKFLASALLALVFVPVESALGQESALDRRAPAAVIKRKVNVGWGSLATGTYRLISVLDEIPNVTGFAEVYFFPIRDTLDLDTGIQALAEFERGRTRLEGVLTSVSYREQNGIVMLDQIETSELILRFTPIPLGLGK
jgi:hypothetical protein